jgi:type IV pilus assembly protein PilC
VLFAFEAMRSDGSTVVDQLDAGDSAAAADALREKGLLVLRLSEAGPAAPSGGLSHAFQFGGGTLNTRDIILFTRQMKMLLEAGTPLVPALEAAEHQTTKPFVNSLLHRIREQVEGGKTLSQALEGEDGTFDPVFRGMIAAGEATATLSESFGRLCALAQQQQQARKMVIGALLYPAVICLLLTGVVGVLLFFVVPRFKILFTNLKSPLPPTTKLLIEASELMRTGWPYLLGGVVAAVVVAVLCFRLPGTRDWLDRAVLRMPIIGRLAARLILARVVRIWAAMLRCHVPLLEAIHQSREAITNVEFLRMVADIEESVSSGGRVGQALAAARLADPIIVSAIRTGEENGRLAEATDFISNWLDEDNTNLVQSVTRLAEPLLLALMGLVVGFVAMSLFIPMFDLATAAG